MSFKIGHKLLETVLAHTNVVAWHGQFPGISCANTQVFDQLTSVYLLMFNYYGSRLAKIDQFVCTMNLVKREKYNFLLKLTFDIVEN